MKAVLDALAADGSLTSALDVLRALPAPTYDDAQWATLVDLFQVLRLGVAALMWGLQRFAWPDGLDDEAER